ncbi:MAG: peroxidase family protein [Bacteroidota bacterium]
MPYPQMHGMMAVRGCPHQNIGSFTRLSPDYTALAVSEAAAAALGAKGGIMDGGAHPSNEITLPAAYIFFAQFIDHDITLDAGGTALSDSPLSRSRIETIPNFRSPTLDLDSVYGFGPEVSPFLYDDGNDAIFGRLRTGNLVNKDDLPRVLEQEQDGSFTGRALIGDPRNDENIFIAQLHLLFLRFHNCLLTKYRATSRSPQEAFEEAQRQARYHFQHLVVFDFLERICDPAVFAYVRDRIRRGDAYPFFYTPSGDQHLPMPAEFSVAAFRFGHTLVRDTYPVNRENQSIQLFDERFGTTGFAPVPPELTVDWSYLLDVDSAIPFARCMAFDHLLAKELIRLPIEVVGSAPAHEQSLAFRNLRRGHVFGLPSGQTVAQQLAFAYNQDGTQRIDPAADVEFGKIPGWSSLDVTMRSELESATPLFFYVLREAGVLGGGDRLGPVGSAILLEVFGGALLACHDSILTGPGRTFRPLPEVAGDGDFRLADVARYVQACLNSSD